MKKFLTALLALLVLACSNVALAQNTKALTQNTSESSNNSNSATKSTKTKTKRGPVFRANKDQVMQAQAILKQRGFYTGEQTGKLDPDTRAGLKKYQAAENMKVTGTLNRATLEKMSITLTDKQRTM